MADIHSIEYRDIPAYPGYRVGSDGSIWYAWRTCRSGRILTNRWKQMKIAKQKKRTSGRAYCSVNLTPPQGGKYQTFRVHRLVLESFIGPCPEGMECRHLDGDPSNNQLNNLAWGTRDENVEDNKNNGSYLKHNRIKLFTYNGQTMCLKDWAKHLSVPYLTLWQRVSNLGMTFEEAITRPFLGVAGNGAKPKKA